MAKSHLIPVIPGLKRSTLLEMGMTGRSQLTSRTFRRYIVAHLSLHSGLNSIEVAKHVADVYGIECSESLVNSDRRWARQNWIDVANLDTEKLVKRELATLAELEDKAGELYTNGQVVDYCDTVLKIQKRRSMLLGLDKPIKVAVHKPRVQDMSDEELAEQIKRGEDALKAMETHGPSN